MTMPRCTYVTTNQRCPAAATHLVLAPRSRPSAWGVWLGGLLPTVDPATQVVEDWRETPPEFCLRHAIDVCQARTHHARPRAI